MKRLVLILFLSINLVGCSDSPENYKHAEYNYLLFRKNNTLEIEAVVRHREPCSGLACVASPCEILKCEAFGAIAPLIETPHSNFDLESVSIQSDFYWDRKVKTLQSQYLIGDFLVKKYIDSDWSETFDIVPLKYIDYHTVIPTTLVNQINQYAGSAEFGSEKEYFQRMITNIDFGYSFDCRVLVILEGKRIKNIWIING